MFSKRIKSIIILTCLAVTGYLYPQQLAFPNAEGYGRFVTGGRGGKVYEVTNLNDAGTGSLRDAIGKNETRTIVFRVSGTIRLLSDLNIRYGNLTIAGQTAPGDGICIAGHMTNIKDGSENIIVRYIRFRLGDSNGGEDDTFWGRNCKNIIIDHCSMTWSIDECASFYDNQNFTMQWCIIGESLYNSTHPKGKHGYGGIQGGMGATFHHNLYTSNTSRNPRFCGARYHLTTTSTEIVDFVNNVIYNWGFNSIYGGELGQQNIRANYYKPGPATIASVRSRILNPSYSTDPVAGYGKFYVADNFIYGDALTTANNWPAGIQGVDDSIRNEVKASAPFQIAEVTLQTPQQAYEQVVLNAGANFPKRDAVDTRLINDLINRSATFDGASYKIDYNLPNPAMKSGIIDSQNDVGGWPLLASAPAADDTDHDGMPDYFEIANGFDPNDGNDGKAIGVTGYSNLELYLNGILDHSVTGISQKESMPNSFTLSQNYPNPFNPATHINFSIPGRGHVEVNVYDIQGRLIKSLVKEEKTAGNYNLVWNGNDNRGQKVASGIYFYSVIYNLESKTKKMLLIK